MASTEVKSQFDKHEDHVFLNFWQKLAYGWTGFGEGILNDTVNNAVMLFYNTVLLVDARWVGWALFLPRFWDMITDPVMGHISDNTRSRWGRRRPYIFFGSFFMAATFLAIWIPPTSLGSRGLFWYLLATSFLYFTFYTMTIVPTFGLGAELTIDYHERTRLHAYRGFLNRIGGLFGGWAWPIAAGTIFASTRFGFGVIAAVYAALSILCFVWAFLGTREEATPQSQEKTSLWKGMKETLSCKPLWILGGIVLCLLMGVLIGFPAQSYLIIYYLYGGSTKDAALLMSVCTVAFSTCSTLGVIPMTWLGLRVGKEKAMFIGTVLFALAPAVSWFVFTPKYPFLMVTFVVSVALALSSVMVYCNSMLADLVDLDEVKTHKRREGSYSSIMSFIFKAPGPIGALAFGYLLDFFAKFDKAAAIQTPETIFRLRLILFIIPFICFSLAAFLAFIYPIREKQVREVRALLESRRKKSGQETVSENV